MVNPSSINSLPILRHTLSEVATLAKPLTKWNKPAKTTLNEQGCKTSRMAIFLIAVSATAIGFILSLSSRKTNLWLAAGSALAGMIFKYRDNTAHILKQRDEVRNIIETFMENIHKQRGKVGNNIGKFNLAKIRLLYPDQNVISDQELSKWASYFLHTQEFENFSHTDWLWICNFQPGLCKLNTPELIKRKYCYRIYHPENPANLMLFKEVLYNAFPEEKQEKIKQLQKIVGEQFKFFSSNDVCKKYKSTVLPDILKAPCAVNAWFFNIYIWNQKIGIKELKEKYETALEPFREYFIGSPEEYIADRDAAALTYDEFVEKNGEAAVQHISNVLCFLKLILQQDLGLKKIEEVYKNDIIRFGDAALIKRAVLKQEWSQLANRTYKEVRDRNGKDAILKVSDPGIRKKLKEKILELTPNELTNEEYQKEVEFLGITDREIIERLHQSGAKMVFSEILKILDSKRKDRILEFFKSEKGRQQAIDEIERLPVAKVLDDYKLLFEKGILDYKDRRFTSRLQNLDAKELHDVLEGHGKFLIEENLLKKDKLVHSISIFIFDKRLDFLTKTELFKSGVWKMFYDFNFINEPFLRLRAKTLNEIDLKEKKHSKENETLKAVNEANLEKILSEVKEKQKELNGKSEKCKGDLSRVDKELKTKKECNTDYVQYVEELKIKFEQKKGECGREQASLANDKEVKKRECGDIKKKHDDLCKKHREKLQSHQKLKKELKEKNQSSDAVKNLKRDKKELKEKNRVLNERRKKLEVEQMEVKARLETLESLIPRSCDQFDTTAYSTSIPELSQNLGLDIDSPSDSQQAQPHETEDLKAQIKKIQIEIADIRVNGEEYQKQIAEKKQVIETAVINFLQYPEYESSLKEIEEMEKNLGTLATKQKELSIPCDDLISRQKKIDDLVSEIESYSLLIQRNEEIISNLKNELISLEDEFKIAQINSQKADEELNSVETKLLIPLKAKEKASYDAKVKIEKEEFEAASKKIKKDAEERLRDIYNMLYY